MTRQSAGAPQAIALNLVYADEAVLVIDKPAGLVMHPAAGNPDGTLQNALLHRDPALADRLMDRLGCGPGCAIVTCIPCLMKCRNSPTSMSARWMMR